MKAGLLFLPFLALLIGAVGTAIGSTLPEVQWVAQVAWALAASVVGLWVFLDFNNFKGAFTRKGAKYGASSGVVVVLGVAIIVGVAVLATRPRFNKSFDLTRDRLNTLSDQSSKLISELKEQAVKGGKSIQITAYVGEDQAQQQLKDLLAMYQANGAPFEIEYLNPVQNAARAMADKVTDANTVILKRGEQEKRVTTFSEEKLTNALVNVMKEKSKKIYFTKGHGEGGLRGTEPNGYSQVVTELEGSKNQVEDLSLLESVKVPDDADMLVIAGPKYDFKEEETRVVEDYLKRGGAVLTMVDAVTPVDTLNKMLEKFGVKLTDDVLLFNSEAGRSPYGEEFVFVTEFDELNPVTRDFARVSSTAMLLKTPRSVAEVADNANKMKVSLAGKSSTGTAIRIKDVRSQADLQSLGEERIDNQGAFPIIAVANGKTQPPATAGNTKTEGPSDKSDAPSDSSAAPAKETRLVVVGSSNFANNFGSQLAAQHKDMFMNMTNYLLQDEDFISIRPKDPTKSTIDLTTPKSQLTLLVLAFIYPFVFLGGGTYVWLKRRRA